MSLLSKLFGSADKQKNARTYDMNNSNEVAYLLGVLARQITGEGTAYIGGNLNQNEITISIQLFESYVDFTNPASQLRSLEFINRSGLRNGEYISKINYKPSEANMIKVCLPQLCTNSNVRMLAESFVNGCNSYAGQPVQSVKDRNNQNSCSYTIEIG